MRIAYITSGYARSSDTFIRNEVIELRARGHVVDTFSLRRPHEAVAPGTEVAAEQATTCYIVSTPKRVLATTIARQLIADPVRVARALRMAWRLSPAGVRDRTMHLFYFLEAVFLAAQLKRLGSEILHNHIAENSATVALLASIVSGVPFSMTVHGPGIFFHPRYWALKEKIAHAVFTACISSFCRSQCMLHSRMADWPKLRIIRCGVGRAFESVAETDPPEAPRFLFVGRLAEEKGLPLLLEAVAQLARSGLVCELDIVGDGPLRSHVEKFVEQGGLGPSVRLLGWQGSAAIAARLAASRALVVPSFAEGLPVVIMEALALARPVIATAIAGVPELVRPGRNGWLVAAGSVDELAAAMREAATAPVQALREMGRLGVLDVRERHSLSAEVDRLEANLAAAVAGAARDRGATTSSGSARRAVQDPTPRMPAPATGRTDRRR